MMSSSDGSCPRIYVADVAAYNSGKLHGAWVSLYETSRVKGVMEEIEQMLSQSPEPIAETWAIHGYEGFFGVEKDLGEYPSIDEVLDVAEIVIKHGELGGLVIGHFCGRCSEARQALEDEYSGAYDSLSDFAFELSEGSVASIPDSIARYIDYEGMGRDLELGGDIFTVKTSDGITHVFWQS